MAALSRTLGSLGQQVARGRLPPSFRLLHASCGRGDSNRTSVARVRRQAYGRLYPVLLVKTDGSTVRVRYKEPKKILTLPLDSNALPEAERKARLRRQFPARFKAPKEEAFEDVNLDEYKKFWKS
ncbi:large ribosomal subunit protein mL55 [Struthio camelus]|uniref:large ribosomal subunit protein mL55 n=1 Tax=Struthio camelus TaxID=8801 RepID=UPI003603B80F